MTTQGLALTTKGKRFPFNFRSIIYYVNQELKDMSFLAQTRNPVCLCALAPVIGYQLSVISSLTSHLCVWPESVIPGPDQESRVSKKVIGVRKAFASLPSEPCVRFSRTRLSSRWFPHRDWLATHRASFMVKSPSCAKKRLGQRLWSLRLAPNPGLFFCFRNRALRRLLTKPSI